MNNFPEFHAFKKIPRLSRDIIVTEKIDGCFNYQSRVLTYNGYKPIGHIVNNKSKIKVLSFNFKENIFEWSNIKSYFKYKSSYKDFLNFKLRGFRQGNAYYSFKCTYNHKLLTTEGYKEARNITLKDKLLSPNNPLTYIQKQMILGTLLGDASLNQSESSLGYVHSQSIKHRLYSKTIVKILGRFYRNTRILKGGYANTNILAIQSNFDYELRQYLERFRRNNKKYFSYTILKELSPISLAFWYMDDGSCSFSKDQNPRLTLHTQGFDKLQINRLLKILEIKFNIFAKAFNYGKGYQIVLNVEDSDKMFNLIKFYITKDLQYKLPLKLRNNICIWDNYQDTKDRFYPQEILEIKPNTTTGNAFHYKYDLETINHNYVVSGVVVHNSNGLIYIDENNNIFAGSRNKWLWGSIQDEIHNDNHGFAQWVKENQIELLKLGKGYHYGEWWGKGIQRGYRLEEKRFSLFNVSRWQRNKNVPLVEKQEYCPDCCDVVPILCKGNFDTNVIEQMLSELKRIGSIASPNFMNPEGIVIYHIAGGCYFKKTIFNDEGKNKEG